MINVIYVAVFDNQNISADTSAARAMAKHEAVGNTIGYQYRQRATQAGPEIRDTELIQLCEEEKPDLVFFVKCNNMDTRVFEECKKVCPIVYWFPDPLVTFREDPSYLEKAIVSDLVFVDKKNVWEEIVPHNKKTFIIPDGFDSTLEIPREVEAQDLDVSFIGNPYGDRLEKLLQVTPEVQLVSNAYGAHHSDAVSRSKINLNFCTSSGPSNRVYKVLAAKGFLLTDDWVDREKEFEDGKHLVIFKDIDDLNEKVAYYLENEEERNRICEEGYKLSSKYTRDEWARKVMEIFLAHKEIEDESAN